MIDGKKKNKKKPGPGMSGSTSMMTKAEERILAKGVEGKIDISNTPKYIAALSSEHKRTGEKKSSYTGRTKRNPTVSRSNKESIGLLDTSTGKRTRPKKKLTQEQKAKEKRAEYNATVGKSRAEKRKYRQR